MRDLFKHSRLIAESLPDPPLTEAEDYPNLEYEAAGPSAPRLVPSLTRVGETDPEIADLQKQWGKPIKIGGPKDNPLDVTLWKLSANDGGGSWFGRRSVHAGMPFSRWREKLSSEYDETLKINKKKIEKGQTPDGSIRGIGAEEKVETMEVKDDDGSELGHLMVYHVSAQFPKPTAPRDFVPMIINSDSGLRIGGSRQSGRSWMMISKPCDHPGVPPKPGYTRGNYESIEVIREIPKNSGSASSSSSQKSKKKDDSSSGDSQQPGRDEAAEENDDEEMNPVEWIMISRSDPGGSIPRWMVDKGTPRSVGVDAAKFINWAIKDDKPQEEEDCSSSGSKSASAGTEAKSRESVNGPEADESDDSDSTSEYDSLDSDGEHSHHGLIASVTGLLNTGYQRLAPQIQGYMPYHEAAGQSEETQTSQGNADTATLSKSISAGQNKALDVESTHDGASIASARSDLVTPVIDEITHTNMPPDELIKMTKTGKLTSHEKDLAKLALRKREIEAKLDSVRAELEKLHLPSQPPTAPGTPLRGLNEADSDTSAMRKRAATNRSSTPASSTTKKSHKHKQSQSSTHGTETSSDGQSSQTQTPEPPAPYHKAASALFNEEAKLLKQLRKIEASQLKTASKIEARQRKEVERSEKSKSKSEVETLKQEISELKKEGKSKSRSEVDGLKQEISDLKKEVRTLRGERQKWVELVSSLQAENTKLAAKGEIE
jgi:FtsZ-binding cell division protein ZapB